MSFLTADQVGCFPMILTEFLEKKKAGVCSRNISLTNKTNWWTHTVASSPVCTSPFINVVGVLDVLMVSNSWKCTTPCECEFWMILFRAEAIVPSNISKRCKFHSVGSWWFQPVTRESSRRSWKRSVFLSRTGPLSGLSVPRNWPSWIVNSGWSCSEQKQSLNFFQKWVANTSIPLMNQQSPLLWHNMTSDGKSQQLETCVLRRFAVRPCSSMIIPPAL